MGVFMKSVAWYLVVAMFIIGIAPRADAAFSPSEQLALAQSDRAADLQKVQAALETKMVRDRLEKLGYAPGEIRARLGLLDDEQLHRLALNLDQLKVGGDALGVIVALLVIAVLVIVILQLTGHKVIVR